MAVKQSCIIMLVLHAVNADLVREPLAALSGWKADALH